VARNIVNCMMTVVDSIGSEVECGDVSDCGFGVSDIVPRALRMSRDMFRVLGVIYVGESEQLLSQ